jgi:hypothetical protein
MKLVRIDDLVAGRSPVELHPQLTVLRGATPEVRERLLRLFRAFGGDQDPGCAGVLEVSGVQLGLDRATLDGLRLDPHVDPVVRWAAPEDAASGATTSPTAAASEAASSGTTEGAASPPLPPLPRWEPPVPVAPHASGDGEAIERELEQTREQLRGVTAQRTELGARMEQVRGGLDSFAGAALEVCVGQIDALESRRSMLRSQWERDRAERSAVRERLVDSVRAHRAALDAVHGLDLTPVRSARDQLERALSGPLEPDPVANELALQIDAAWQALRDVRGRTASAELRRHEAEQRLAEATADATIAEHSMRTRVFDRSDVARLEQVRDEIFAVDDRQSRLSAHRNRRKLQELRAEEAVLLERLGFDTYSSYVMGIPSVRAELERSSRLDAATTRIEHIERELQSLAADAPDPREVRNAEADLERLFSAADELLGIVGDHDRSRVSNGTEDVVHDLITALRSHRVARSSEHDPEVRAAAAQLRRAAGALAGAAAVASSAGSWSDAGAVPTVVWSVEPVGAGVSDPTSPHGMPPVVADHQLDPAAWSGAPHELLSGVDVWLVQLDDLGDWTATQQLRLRELEEELAQLDGDDLHRAEVSEWAVVEAELDAALDRLGAAEERVRVHDQAMAQLAELRDAELGLRSQERELLGSLARLEQVRREHPLGSGDERSGIPPTSRLPPAYTPPVPSTARATAAPSTEPRDAERWSTAEQAEWRLVRRLAAQRAVSFVGSVPVLLDGLPDDGEARRAVCERLRRMGELVQVVVMSDDAATIGWAEGLGLAGAVRTV